ncbi:pirin family protein [Wenzhouxiangella sp. XN79A]|uniref:pirin family protein n=1 Tax=Wenzhouxiangella sp. XN79A TaxID=2724193 RepID=UPI00144ACA38|nr:pirin family protein [Wenzhouxiangella sp. XN79A]NKI33812.1 pirin family protein [Wenzhouxiangella sp. XN79A]
MADPISGVDQVIVPRSSDIDGFEVARVLASRERRMVGPFVSFDRMGPGEFMPGRDPDVRPGPSNRLRALAPG